MADIKARLIALVNKHSADNADSYNELKSTIYEFNSEVTEEFKELEDKINEIKEQYSLLMTHFCNSLAILDAGDASARELIVNMINESNGQESTPVRHGLTPATPIGRQQSVTQQRVGIPIVNNSLGNVVSVQQDEPVASHITVRRPDGTPVILANHAVSQGNNVCCIAENVLPVTTEDQVEDEFPDWDPEDDPEDDNVATMQMELEDGEIVECYCEKCMYNIDVDEANELAECPICGRIFVGRRFVCA